jgi:hypothetical protein
VSLRLPASVPRIHRYDPIPAGSTSVPAIRKALHDPIMRAFRDPVCRFVNRVASESEFVLSHVLSGPPALVPLVQSGSADGGGAGAEQAVDTGVGAPLAGKKRPLDAANKAIPDAKRPLRYRLAVPITDARWGKLRQVLGMREAGPAMRRPADASGALDAPIASTDTAEAVETVVFLAPNAQLSQRCGLEIPVCPLEPPVLGNLMLTIAAATQTSDLDGWGNVHRVTSQAFRKLPDSHLLSPTAILRGNMGAITKQSMLADALPQIKPALDALSKMPEAETTGVRNPSVPLDHGTFSSFMQGPFPKPFLSDYAPATTAIGPRSRILR